jgi:aspartyl-tRNA(Asn)/glutamyl-tRNA(Gln) amidotransferase subunit A
LNPTNLIALDGGIMQQGKRVTAGSKMLDGFVSPINATVADRLTQAGFSVVEASDMRELGLYDLLADAPPDTLGAVQAVADGLSAYALANDVFGLYRRQAADRSLFYIRPTYGTVSRYGLVPTACSMDQIGVVCKNAADGFALLTRIAGRDEKDGAMLDAKGYEYKATDKKLTLGIPSDIIQKADAPTRQSIQGFCDLFASKTIRLDYFDVYATVLTVLAGAEITANLSRYDGVKYGSRAADYKGLNDLYVKTRSQGFGRDAKLMAVLGNVVLSQSGYEKYYFKAMQIRRLIRQSLTFDTYDFIVLPCAVDGSPCQNLSLYALTALAGLPSVTFGYKGQGLQLVAAAQNEGLLLSACKEAFDL